MVIMNQKNIMLTKLDERKIPEFFTQTTVSPGSNVSVVTGTDRFIRRSIYIFLATKL